MDGKALVQSKTFWIAVLQALLGAATVFNTAYPEVGLLLLVKSALDIVLRIYTTQTISSVAPQV
jgi:hypothetical protein